MHDKFKKKYRTPRGGSRLRQQIAAEAARRMISVIGPEDGEGPLREATEAEYYAAKRRAAAVLGHTVRPGDLPSDSEVREQVLALVRSNDEVDLPDPPEPEPEDDALVERIGDVVDRFMVYRLRLIPLEAVKQSPKYHPEGDALYHSLQVFDLARHARPYDEEFLLAALLHDVGKAIDPRDHVAAALEALRGTITERTTWLIAHHMDLMVHSDRSLSPKARQSLQESAYFEDLILLRDLDEAGRIPGVPVGTADEALDYLRGLEVEAYLDPTPEPPEDDEP
ncbi:MAG: HD domain-containing protein [Isosphaeraceae bacterium]